MTHVLIAADDSEESLHAARTARSLFGDAARYTVVSVADTRGFLWSGSAMEWGVPYAMAVPAAGAAGPPLVFDQPTDDERNRPIEVAERQADDVAAAAHLPGAGTIGEVGDPAATIVRAAKDCGADVIVIGSHDRSWLSKLFTPSVSAAVVHDSSVPVLLVR